MDWNRRWTLESGAAGSPASCVGDVGRDRRAGGAVRHRRARRGSSGESPSGGCRSIRSMLDNFFVRDAGMHAIGLRIDAGDRADQAGRGDQGAGSGRGCRRRGEPPEDGELGEPRQWPHRLAQVSDGDLQERPDHLRVELRAGASGQLEARLVDRHRLLVRASGGDHIEHVGDGDQAAGIGDVGARQPVRIARSVELLVMLTDGAVPSRPTSRRWARGSDRDPRQDGSSAAPIPRQSACPGLRRISPGTRNLPMSWSNAAQRTFSRSSELQLQLCRKQVRQGPDAFGVASGQRVVMVQGGDQRQQVGGAGRVVGSSFVCSSRRASCLVVPVRSATEKRDGTWSGNTSDSFSNAASGRSRRASRSVSEQHSRRRGEHADQPYGAPRHVAGRGDQPRQYCRPGDRGDDRRGERDQADRSPRPADGRARTAAVDG